MIRVMVRAQLKNNDEDSTTYIWRSFSTDSGGKIDDCCGV